MLPLSATCPRRDPPASVRNEETMSELTPKVWYEGRLIDMSEAKLPFMTHTFHYGLGAFEGIRAYRQKNGVSAVFRLKEHIDRLFETAHLITIGPAVNYTREQVIAACVETLQANHMSEGYLRPVIFIAEGKMGLGAMANPIHTAIAAWKWGAYLGEEGLKKGIRAKISSFQRSSHASVMSKGKVTGQYVNSILAKREALLAGYDEAILLNKEGYVTEASGENVFMVRDGRVITPPYSLNILGGITRATVLRLAADLGYATEERVFARDEVYCADEVFMTGTAAEVTPVREVDDRRIGVGARGPITEQLQQHYFDTVRGAKPEYAGWLTPYEVND